MKNNGHEKETIPTKGENKKNEPLNANSLEGLFDTPERPDSTRLLFEVSSDIPEQAMRGYMPNNAFCLGYALAASKCLENDYPEGMFLLKTFSAGLAGKGGKRANLYSDTIIGEKQNYARGGQGFMSKAKEFMAGGE